MYILVLGNMELNGYGEFIFNDTKMKIAGNWENKSWKMDFSKWNLF